MKRLYKYEEDFGRMGALTGFFVADDADVEKAMGEEPRFGEVLGKHSNITGTISPETVKVVEEATPEFIALFEKLGLATGTNPLHSDDYWDEGDDDDDDDDDDDEEEE